MNDFDSYDSERKKGLDQVHSQGFMLDRQQTLSQKNLNMQKSKNQNLIQQKSVDIMQMSELKKNKSRNNIQSNEPYSEFYI